MKQALADSRAYLTPWKEATDIFIYWMCGGNTILRRICLQAQYCFFFELKFQVITLAANDEDYSLAKLQIRIAREEQKAIK